jgi:hypothetical protein
VTDPDNRPAYWDMLFGGKEQTRPTVTNPAPPVVPTTGSAQPYAMAALAREVAELSRATEGYRNHRLNIAAFNLSQLVAGGYLDRDDVWNALYTTSLAIGLTEDETVATLRSGLNAGTLHPRVVAELDGVEVPPVTTMTDEQERTEPTNGSVADEPPTIGDRFPPIDWYDLWEQEDDDEWIVYPILPARRLVALFSPPKVGKSLLMLELAVAISRGTEALGNTPDGPRRVLYVDFENDPRGDIRSRLKAMGMKPADLSDLVYLSYPRLAYLDTHIGGLELLAIAQHYGCEVVVIDTISRAVSGEENDNDTWLSFYRNTGQLLKAAGIAAIRLDHTGKDETKGMRGGSAKYGDVDLVWAMSRITDTKFRVECTANRLPVGEKVLLLERRSEPNLHHAVSLEWIADAVTDEADQIVAVLRRLKAPVGTGRDKAFTMLAGAGVPKPSLRVMKEAMRRLRELEISEGQGTTDELVDDE